MTSAYADGNRRDSEKSPESVARGRRAAWTTRTPYTASSSATPGAAATADGRRAALQQSSQTRSSAPASSAAADPTPAAPNVATWDVIFPICAKALRNVGGGGGRGGAPWGAGASRIDRDEQGPQTKRMQDRQWCRRFANVNGAVHSRHVADAESCIQVVASAIVVAVRAFRSSSFATARFG